MKRPKKSSSNVQMSSDLTLEPANKLLPLITLKKSPSNGTKHKDEGTPPSDIWSFHIEVALNGFLVTVSYSDAEIADEKYVAQTIDDVISLLKDKF